MEYRPLDLKIIKANNIKDVNLMSKMDVYAVVSISGDYSNMARQRTSVDKDGGTNPKWNHSMKFAIDEALAQQNRLILKIKLISDRTLGDREIGEVDTPIKELLDNGGGDAKFEKTVTYSVRTSKGKAKGTVDFSYRFGEKYSAAAQPPPHMAEKMAKPVTAYPPGHVGSSVPYTPTPPGGVQASPYPYAQPGVYGQPPQAGYGYPPQGPQPPVYGYGGYGAPPQPGYGYPPVQQPQKPNKSRMGGMGGMGLGLGAGLLGGLLVGDMISDVGEMDAYDAGFDDGGGFDF